MGVLDDQSLKLYAMHEHYPRDLYGDLTTARRVKVTLGLSVR